MSEAGRCRPASGFEIRDALRGRVHSYGAETRSHLSDEWLRAVLRTQQKQHLSSLLSFAKASWYPSGQLRIMSAMIGPPLIRDSNGTRKPGSSCVHDENYNLPNSSGRQPISNASYSLNSSGNLFCDLVRAGARALALSPVTRCPRVGPLMGMRQT